MKQGGAKRNPAHVYETNHPLCSCFKELQSNLKIDPTSFKYTILSQAKSITASFTFLGMATDTPRNEPLPISTSRDDTLIASCQCGRVKVQLPSKPTYLNECHCTVCYKYGALWAYFKRPDVTVLSGAAQLQKYIREDSGGDISFNRCSYCGCMVLWYGEGKFAGPEHKMGVNCRMLPESELKGIEKRISRK
jgi:hypothetical protein